MCLQTSAFTDSSAAADSGVNTYTKSIAPDASTDALRIKPNPRHAGKKRRASSSSSPPSPPTKHRPRRTPRRYRAARARARRARPVLHEHRDVRDAHFPRPERGEPIGQERPDVGSVSGSVSEKLFNSFLVVSFGIPSSSLGSRLRREETVASRRRDRRRLSSRPDRFDRFDFLHRARGRTPSPDHPLQDAGAGVRRRPRDDDVADVFVARRERFSAPRHAAPRARASRASAVSSSSPGPRQPFGPTRAVHHQNGRAPGRRVFSVSFASFSASSRCRTAPTRASVIEARRVRRDRPARGWGPRRRRRAARVAAATAQRNTRASRPRGWAHRRRSG